MVPFAVTSAFSTLIAAYSIIVFFYPLRLFSVERAFESNELKAGDELKVTMTIRRSVPFPLYYVVIEDQGSELLASPLGWKKKTVVHPGWRRAFSYTYTIDHLPENLELLWDEYKRAMEVAGHLLSDRSRCVCGRYDGGQSLDPPDRHGIWIRKIFPGSLKPMNRSPWKKRMNS